MSDTVELPPEMRAEIASGLDALKLDVPVEPADESDAALAAAADATEQATETDAEPPKPKKAETKAPTEPEPAKDQTPAGKLALQLARANKALATERATLKTQRAEFETQRTRVEQLNAQLESEARLAREDPITWLQKRHGLSVDDIAHRLMNGGKARPEEAQGARDRENQELRQRLETLENERRQEAQVAAQERELVKFVSEARGDETRWPLASKYSEQRLRAKGLEIVAKLPKGARPSNADILDQIEEELGEVVRLTGATPGKAKPAAGAVVVKKGDRRIEAQPTLAGATRDGASQADEDIDFLSLSEDDRKKLLMRALRTNGARN